MDPLLWLSQIFSNEITILTMAALPIVELRGSIPLAIYSFNMPPWEAYILSVIGSLIPAPILLFFFEPIANFLKNRTPLKKFVDFTVRRSMKRGKVIKRYRSLGLLIFIAIPLPTTGVWTGCMVANLLGMKFKEAFIPVVLGTMAAGIIVLSISTGIINL